MKIGMMSDTHTIGYKGLTLPKVDLVIHAGDVMNTGKDVQELVGFLEWYVEQPNKPKTFILCAGNHDWWIYHNPEEAKVMCEAYGVTLLIDEGLEVDDLLVYATPWQPEFCNWAYNLPKGCLELKQKWTAIPTNTDILVTHCPPYGILDSGFGDYNLQQEVFLRVKPQLHVFGHNHRNNGIHLEDGVCFCNATLLNDMYKAVNKITVVTLL